MAQFRVETHLEVTNHGSFLVGQIEEGTIRIGDHIESEPSLTVAAVEFVDHIGSQRFQIALGFRESRSKQALEQQFPTGTRVGVRAN